ncbi:hypothetical protein [Bacillus safensis]|uniref:hypothetical protein n=2 Tax=Bacillus safensis TaxID=561879 RepID=UPI001E2DAA8F|nr:hypothetical protein [Bacillus safensis]MEC1046098.1 hypothetical protein [Bacillus safensis]
MSVVLESSLVSGSKTEKGMPMEHKQNKKISNWLLSISVLIVIGTALLRGVSYSDADYRGFPIDWLVLHGHHTFEFLVWGFILDVVIFYFLLKMLLRLYKRVMKKSAT